MPDEPQEATGQPQERPAWLPDKFENEEAFARSYRELESRLTQEAQARSEAERYAEELAQQQAELEMQQQQVAPQLPFNPFVAQLEQAREMGDTQAEFLLNAYVTSNLIDQRLEEKLKNFAPQQQAQQADPTANELYGFTAETLARERFENQYGIPWQEIRDEAGEWLRARPGLLPENLPVTGAADALYDAAETVLNARIARGTLTGQEQADNQQTIQRQNRMLSQTMRGAGQPPPAVDEAEAKWEAIKNAPTGSYASLRNSG